LACECAIGAERGYFWETGFYEMAPHSPGQFNDNFSISCNGVLGASESESAGAASTLPNGLKLRGWVAFSFAKSCILAAWMLAGLKL